MCSKENAAMGYQKTQAARHKKFFFLTIFLNEVEKFDANIFERWKKLENSSGTKNAMRDTCTHPTAKTPTLKVAVSIVGGRGGDCDFDYL